VTGPQRLVLWDIDGTLVAAGQAGRDVFAEAFRVVVGRPPEAAAARAVAMAGRTDGEIALELLAAHRIADGESHLPAFADALAEALAAAAATLRERGRALPGAAAALEAIARRPGVVQSVLTGNIEANAALKLATFGLDAHLDLAVGGFGSDDRHRPNLVRVARGKAGRKYGAAFDGVATVLVGDTPLDVAAARASGARAVVVATGSYGADELRGSGPDALLEDLRDTDAVVRAVLSPARGRRDPGRPGPAARS
jgi:phosphoglycolate phosphatase